jgi:hypothetical protein
LRSGIGVKTVPHVEEKGAARPQDSSGLAVSGDPVGKEHRAELADHQVEGRVRERQGLRVGRRESYALII